MNCYLCAQEQINKRLGSVRDNETLEILECTSCGLVFLSSFDHISDDYYEQSGMHQDEMDIKKWINETNWDDERRFIFLQKLIENKRVLDFGCGNGGFLLKAREIAGEVAGVELEKRLMPHFQQLGLRVFRNVEEAGGSFDVITLFHVLEHLPDPVGLLQHISQHLVDHGQLIIEVPNANDALLKLYQSGPFSHFTYWSCHLYLFTQSTLEHLARKAGLKVNYIKQIQRYPLSNHLYWLANGKPGGHRQWSFLDSPEMSGAYEKSLAAAGLCDTIIASFSKKI